MGYTHANGGGGKRRGIWSSNCWDAVAACSSVLMLIFGLCVWAVSQAHLTGITATSGVLLGGSCMCLAILGMLVCALPIPPSLLSCASPALGGITSSTPLSPAKLWAARLSMPLRVGLLVGLSLSALGSLLLLEQVAHDVSSQCVLAEASVRISHLEEAVTKLKHDELLTQVFFRLNELDDLMSGVAQSSSNHAELRSQTFHLQLQDRDMIRERVDRLKRHAEQLLDEMQGSAARTRIQISEIQTEQDLQSEQLQAATVGSGGLRRRTKEELMQERARLQKVEEDKKAKEQAMTLLEQRAQAIQSVLHYLDLRSHDAHAALTFEEYEVVLSALLEGSTNLPNLSSKSSESGPPSPTAAILRESLTKDQEAKGEIQNAFARRQTGAYDKMAGQPHNKAKQLAGRQQQARAEFEARFFNSFEGGAGHTNPAIFSSTLAAALDSLPTQCLDDVAAYTTLRWLGSGLLFVQTATGYVVANGLLSKLVGAKRD